MQLLAEMRRVGRGLVETEEAAHGRACVWSASPPEKPVTGPISLISHADQHLPSGGPGHPVFAYVSPAAGLAATGPSGVRRKVRARVMSNPGRGRDPGTRTIVRGEAEMAEALDGTVALRPTEQEG